MKSSDDQNKKVYSSRVENLFIKKKEKKKERERRVTNSLSTFK